MKNDGGPAFAHGNPEQGGDPGMSLRDWFAGQVIGDVVHASAGFSKGAALCAQVSYEIADEMIKARDK